MTNIAAGTRTRVHKLEMLGQSVWLDSLRRDWLLDGTLARFRDELGIMGVTTNPTIFAAALKDSDAYDDDIRALGAALDDRAVFDALAIADVQRACDVLAPVHKRTNGRDGLVSLELEPAIAHDASRSVERGLELWARVDRPNAMIKVPGTDEGLQAFEELTVAGVNVNVTLLFDVAIYRRVMERHMSAIERRYEAGDPSPVQSVASFFVSRIDTAVDKLLAEHGADGAALMGKTAVANAALAFEAHGHVYAAERFLRLHEAGAAPQRTLWASTGTKNPQYSDILYVENLIGPETVSTMPLATIEAFNKHGHPQTTLEDVHISAHHTVMHKLEKLGIDIRAVTDQLLKDGLESFAKSDAQIIDIVHSKRTALAGSAN